MCPRLEIERIGGSCARLAFAEYSLLAVYPNAGGTERAYRLIARPIERRSPVEVAGYALDGRAKHLVRNWCGRRSLRKARTRPHSPRLQPPTEAPAPRKAG